LQPTPDLLLAFIKPLNRLGLDYMVTGSMAVIVYGEPRLTHDVDIVLVLPKTAIPQLHAALPLAEFYCPPEEVLLAEAARQERGHFNLIHHASGFKADIYLASSDLLHGWGMSRRRRIEIGGEVVQVAPPEYVIVRKLEYYREGGSEKHLRDIQGMLELSRDQIDLPEIQGWVNNLRLNAEWEQVAPNTSATPIAFSTAKPRTC
jgi:hypothetical protein